MGRIGFEHGDLDQILISFWTIWIDQRPLVGSCIDHLVGGEWGRWGKFVWANGLGG